MEDLQGKVALVTGVANKRSIAYAIAADFAAKGAQLVIAYQRLDKEGTAEKIKRVTEDLSPALLVPMDATDPASVTAMYQAVAERFGKLHVLVHAIASSRRQELGGRYSQISLDGYMYALNVSSYSLIALTREARALMSEGGSILTLTYIGSERAMLNYNVMGSAKAALEANVRYLARELGPEGIRVNAISAGPIRTLSASGVQDFLDLLHQAAEASALKRNVTLEEVAHTATFLAGDGASGITGQVIHVDAGFNIFGGGS